MTSYIGRFAPSPSGPLHLGSLACAMASYLDAKCNRGKWLLRIEDIDPPREQIGAKEAIKKSLIAHGLVWDGPIRAQSECSHQYINKLKRLDRNSISNSARENPLLVYRCNCVRKRLNSLNGQYDGHCLRFPPPLDEPAALRLNVAACLKQLKIDKKLCFEDLYQGKIAQDLTANGDFIIHRKDELFAYQLAVVSDDIDQGVTHVIRGCDLLDMTAQQILLYHLFNAMPPRFGHSPVIVDSQGRKLSKQNRAPQLDNNSASKNLLIACRALGLVTPDELSKELPDKIIAWALDHWPIANLLCRREIQLCDVI